MDSEYRPRSASHLHVLRVSQLWIEGVYSVSRNSQILKILMILEDKDTTPNDDSNSLFLLLSPSLSLSLSSCPLTLKVLDFSNGVSFSKKLQIPSKAV